MTTESQKGPKLTKDDIANSESGNPETKTGVEKEAKNDGFDKENEKLKAKLYDLEKTNKILADQLAKAQEEKRKPGIPVVEEDGKENRKKRPNSFGLSDLVLPPYTKNRVAIYRIIAGDGGINPATQLPVESFDVSVPGQYTFFDRWEKDPGRMKKVIQNIVKTRNEIQDGKPVVVDEMEDIIFQRGWKHVDVQRDYPTYLVLELHPNNKNNKFRPHNAPVLFERVDINMRSTVSMAITQDLIIDAGVSIRKLSKEDVLAYATAVPEINASSTRKIGDIKADLLKWAMTNPVPYFKLNKNTEAGVKIMVADAESLGLLTYKPDKKSYILTETDETIVVHTAAEDPTETLIKFLNKPDGEGRKWCEAIQKRMSWWEELAPEME